MNLWKGFVLTVLVLVMAFSPAMAQDTAADQQVIASNTADEAQPPAVVPPEQDPVTYAPVKIVVNIDGKPAEGGNVTLVDKVDNVTMVSLGIDNGTAKTVLRKDHHYMVKYTSGDLKFKSDGAVWVGEPTDSAKVIISYNSKNKKWEFTWKKFGDNEKCSLYIDVKRSNGSVPKNYHITLINDNQVVLQDVWFGKDGKFSFLLPKPEKGEPIDKFFALLTSNSGPDFRYRFHVGPESNRIRHELVIPAKKAPKDPTSPESGDDPKVGTGTEPVNTTGTPDGTGM